MEYGLTAAFGLVAFLSAWHCMRLGTSLLPLATFAGAWFIGLASHAALRVVYPALSTDLILLLGASLFVATLMAVLVTHIASRSPVTQTIGIPTKAGDYAVLLAVVGLVGAAASGIISIRLFANGDFLLPLTGAEKMRMERFGMSATGLPASLSLAELAYYMSLSASSAAIVARHRRTRTVLALSLTAGLIMLVTTASRAPLILLLIVAALSVVLRDGVRPALQMLWRPRILAAIGCLWLAGSLITENRDDGVQISYAMVDARCGNCLPDSIATRGLVSNALYGASSVSNLADFLTSAGSATTILDEDIHFVSGVVSPFARLGFDVQADSTEVLPGGPTNFEIFAGRARYNTYTAYRDLILDFGVGWSVVVVGALMALATALCAGRRRTPVLCFLTLFLLIWMLTSPFVNAFGPLGKALLGGLFGAFFMNAAQKLLGPLRRDNLRPPNDRMDPARIGVQKRADRTRQDKRQFFRQAFAATGN